MKWLKRIFHRHEIVITSREKIANTILDFTVAGGTVDIQPATKYIYRGYCFKCGEKLKSIRVISEMFDKEQPYDIPTTIQGAKQ